MGESHRSKSKTVNARCVTSRVAHPASYEPAVAPDPPSGHHALVTDVPYSSDIERLEHNILTEIRPQNGIGGLDLDDATMRRLASCITANVDDAFEVAWQPRWVRPGDPHRWVEHLDRDRHGHFVACLRCKRITVHATSESAEAWYADHQRMVHSRLSLGARRSASDLRACARSGDRA